MAAIKISPTLIIGLGSSGLEMINAVRELFYEELGYAGLPLVRFLHISSHTGGETIKSLPNEQFTNEWEKIKIADASIGRDRYQQVKLKINPDNHLYQPELAEWLNPRVADIHDVAFDAGAGNFRPAGRLCLWTNWKELTEAITLIDGQMQFPEGKENTEDILREYARRKNMLVEQGEQLSTDANPRAFVAGTTVGGTGSGMLIDLGYFFRKYHHHYKTYGIFTTMDAAISEKPESERRAANAYAAVVELDYFSQLGTKFNYQFPNTREPLDLDTSPYNDVYLLSTKNKDGTIASIVDRSGKPDLASLHKMIGISIFFDVFGGAGSEKEAIKADYHAKTGVFPLVRTRPQYLKFLSTFGATALWFPKSRISGAAAAKIITTTISRWQGSETPNRAVIDLLHNSIIDSLEDQMRIRLSQFLDDDGTQTTVVAHWSRDLERIRERLDSQSEDIQSIMHYLQASSDSEPNPVGHRFKRNSFYFQKMEFNLPSLKTGVLKILEQQIDRQIQNIFSQFDDSDQNITFNDLTYLVDRICETVDTTSRQRADIIDYDLDFSQLEPNFEAIEVEQSRMLTGILGIREKVLEQHYVRVYNKLKEVLEEETNILLDYFLIEAYKQVLPELKSKLLLIFKQHVTKLSQITSRARQAEAELSIVTSHAALKMISQEESIKVDIDKYYKKIDYDKVKQLIEPLNLYHQLRPDGPEPQEIFGSMMRELQREILNHPELAQFDIIRTVQQREPGTINDYAKNAQPMLEFSRDYVPMELPTVPTLLAGGKIEARRVLREQLSANGLDFGREMAIDLDHLLYFYREESVIAISELKPFSTWQKQYIGISRRDEFGSHIDKDPNRFDIEIHHTIREIKENHWLKISEDLFKGEIFQDSGSNGRYLTFQYHDEFENERKMTFDPAKPQTFTTALARNKKALEQFREKFERNFQVLGREGVNTRIVEHLERLDKNDFIKPEFRQEEEDFYNKLLNEKCPK